MVLEGYELAIFIFFYIYVSTEQLKGVYKMQSINLFQNNSYLRPQTQMEPDSYAKKYAEQNNISVDEAKAQLQAKYGAPEQQSSIFSSDAAQNNINSIDFSELGLNEDDENFSLKGMFQQFLDFLKGGESSQNGEGANLDINPETNSITGPQKEGDYNPFSNSEDSYNPFSNSEDDNNEDYMPFYGQDPDDCAQIYADANNMTLEEAKKELKSLFGDPKQQ